MSIEEFEITPEAIIKKWEKEYGRRICDKYVGRAASADLMAELTNEICESLAAVITPEKQVFVVTIGDQRIEVIV